MDRSETVTTVEWCAGYGGIGLGLKGVFGERLRCVAYSDVEGFVQANLVSKMEEGLLDAAPLWPNLKTFPCAEFHGLVDILVAGFPCQPFSHAGKRDGDEDPRHLFPYIKRAAEVMRPRLLFLENVEGLISAKLAGEGWNDPAGTPVLLHVIRELERIGYTAAWGIFSASEVGAPHQRKRVFILAYDTNTGTGKDKRGIWEGISGVMRGERAVKELGKNQINPGRQLDNPMQRGCERLGQVGTGRQAADMAGEAGNVWPSRPGERQYAWEPPRVVGNPKRIRLEPAGDEGTMGEAGGGSSGEGCKPASSAKESSHPGNIISQVESPMGGNINGPTAGLDFSRCTGLSDTELEDIYGWMVKGTNRTDELRMCGNGVVPQTAERAFRVLYRELTGREI